MEISRSDGIIIAWLSKENLEWSWNDALQYENKSHFISPAVKIRDSVLDYFENIEGKRRE